MEWSPRFANENHRYSNSVKYLIGILHFVIIVLVLISPSLVTWKLVLLGALLYLLQLYLFGGCVLTRAQFGTYDDTFYAHIFNALHIPVNPIKLKFFVDFILPVIIVMVAVFLQVILNLKAIWIN